MIRFVRPFLGHADVADDRDHRGFKLPHEDEANYGWGKNSFRPVYGATGTPQGLGKYKSKATGIANVAGRSAAAMALGYQVFKGFSEKNIFVSDATTAALEVFGKNMVNTAMLGALSKIPGVIKKESTILAVKEKFNYKGAEIVEKNILLINKITN